jgi:hypothetical protein
MDSARHFGRNSYKSSQRGPASYISSFTRKASIEFKSSTEGDPANSHELIPIQERFLDRELSFQKDKLTRHSVHFPHRNNVDGSSFNGKTDLIQSRFLANHKRHNNVEHKSPKIHCTYNRNSKNDLNVPTEDINLNKKVSNKLSRKI